MPNLSDTNNWIVIYEDSWGIFGEPTKQNRLSDRRIAMPFRANFHRITIVSNSALFHW